MRLGCPVEAKGHASLHHTESSNCRAPTTFRPHCVSASRQSARRQNRILESRGKLGAGVSDGAGPMRHVRPAPAQAAAHGRAGQDAHIGWQGASQVAGPGPTAPSIGARPTVIPWRKHVATPCAAQPTVHPLVEISTDRSLLLRGSTAAAVLVCACMRVACRGTERPWLRWIASRSARAAPTGRAPRSIHYGSNKGPGVLP